MAAFCFTHTMRKSRLMTGLAVSWQHLHFGVHLWLMSECLA